MLMIILPLIMLSIMYKKNNLWSNIIFILLLLSFMLMPYFYYDSLYMISKWSMMDKLSIPLIMLTMWISSMMILASYKINLLKNNDNMFMLCIMLLNLILCLCFMSSNIIMFYILFEASLIPTAILIMKWGYQPERLQASLYLIMYTVLASLPMLICLVMITIYSDNMNFTINDKFLYPFNNKYMWLLCIIGFLVKLPMYTTHLWLPKAHVEAPVAGSMILAAILLKLGGYGLYRMSYMFPWLNKSVSSFIISLSLIGGIITSIICLRQSDLKSLIAYSSVSHMGLLIAGMMTSTKWGLMGSLAMMIAHGLSSSALFILANMNYDFIMSRSIYLSKGTIIFAPIMSMWWFLFAITNMAAPPSINLMSEIMLITSITSISYLSMILLGIISFLTAGYSMYMYTSINHANSNNYTSIYPSTINKDFTLLMLHMLPIILVIMKPELII
uniref:NADH dehydrogenase subunit 4 n=1 Tax=Glossiphonia complanata TaxID=60927 RepID=UPI0020698C26|nr:NADH dehydrogenase subunit 4 [Glossiphonia complanata]UPP55805.1 NADH dehydrogenase subunit 4 [Glossiphonia complanata]UZT67716.1 NADH dehydrogenase subunit 4 [Glossiphonia complanata]